MMDVRQRAALSVVLAIVVAVTLLPRALDDGNGEEGTDVTEPGDGAADDATDDEASPTSTAPPDDGDDSDDADDGTSTTSTAPPEDGDDTGTDSDGVTPTSSLAPITTVPASTAAASVIALGARAVGALIPGRPGVVSATVSSTAADTQVVTVTIQVTGATIAISDDPACVRSALTVTCVVEVGAGAMLDLPVTITVDAGAAAVGVTVSATVAGTDPSTVIVSVPTSASGLGARLALTGQLDATVVGNTLASCADGDSVGPVTCAQARAGSAPTALSNDDWAMAAVTEDLRPAGSSSSAPLTGIDGESVVAALIIWAASTDSGIPTGAASVRLATPATAGGTPPADDGDYVLVTADDTAAVAGGWQSVADVTELVAAAGSGEYWVADIASALGASDAWAGWALVVVHASGGPVRDVVVFDGLSLLAPSATSVDLPSTADVVTPDLVMVTWDGDRADPGEAFRLTHGSGSVELANSLNPDGDAANSSITANGVAVANRLPSYANTLGVDIDRFGLGSVARPIQVAAASTGDDVLLGAVVATLAH